MLMTYFDCQRMVVTIKPFLVFSTTNPYFKTCFKFSFSWCSCFYLGTFLLSPHHPEFLWRHSSSIKYDGNIFDMILFDMVEFYPPTDWMIFPLGLFSIHLCTLIHCFITFWGGGAITGKYPTFFHRSTF